MSAKPTSSLSDDLLRDVHRVLGSHGSGGMTQKQLEAGLAAAGISSLTGAKLAEALNALLRQAQVTIAKHQETGEYLYIAQGQERASQFKGLGMEDMMVYVYSNFDYFVFKCSQLFLLSSFFCSSSSSF